MCITNTHNEIRDFYAHMALTYDRRFVHNQNIPPRSRSGIAKQDCIECALSSRLRTFVMMLAAAARIRLRSARIRLRSARITAWITWFADVVRICIAGHCAAVLQCVRRLDLFREQTRESRTDRVLLRFHCHEASREHTELHRNDDFLFACYT